MPILLLLLVLVIPLNCHAIPAQVILIRHAEKPSDGIELSVKGKIRAAALVPFFLEEPEMLQFGTPVAIYAMRPEEGGSVRPIETVQGLANALHLELKTPFYRSEHKELAHEILTTSEYEGKMVLVCWEHQKLTDIAHALGVAHAPEWKKNCYDQVWRISFTAKETAHKLDTFPQKLLYGDSK